MAARSKRGDAILGLPSTGLHTNGFSLARRVLATTDWNAPIDASRAPDAVPTLGDALLAVHRSYLGPGQRLVVRPGSTYAGMAHITGGGFVDNLPRILPPNAAAHIHRGTWPELPIFQLIQRQGAIGVDEMFHVFNMGLGMLVVTPQAQVDDALNALEHGAFHVGEIIPGAREVIIN